MMIHIDELAPLGKGRYKIILSNKIECTLYRSELARFDIEQDGYLSEDKYNQLINEVIQKRATKRAMYLLEQMDRTESQLREKLAKGNYPEQCIDAAIEYLKSFHYLDDYRFAKGYVYSHQHALSKNQIKIKLMQKGISRDDILSAIEEEYESDELLQIYKLLEKKHYNPEDCDSKAFNRIYQYIARRGFKSNDILKAMKVQYIGRYLD